MRYNPRMRLAAALIFALAACFAALPAAAGSPAAPASPGPCVRPGFFEGFARDPDLPPTVSHPLLLWPMEHALNEGTLLGNYPDDDPEFEVVHDYMGRDAAGDGHTGTDFGIHSFRAMDRGVEVYAAADGVVAYKQDGMFDRSIGAPWPDDGNYLAIDHGDGSLAWYLHLRKHSLTVDPGESVTAGQMIGFAGSSGYTWGPHLHFELGEYLPGWTLRDPWHGAYNTLPSLWIAQEPYVGDVPAIVHDLGILTPAAAGGPWIGVTYEQLLEGFVPCPVYGADEIELALWILFQGNPGGAFTMEVRRPDGSLFWTVTFPIAFQAFPQTGIFPIEWDARLGPADHGTWTARALVDGAPVVEKPFVVGAATRHAPRFRPAGRSYRIDGTVQRDTLRVDALGGPAVFTLLGAPDFVALEEDSVLRVDAVSSQAARSLFFQVEAANGAGDADTMWCHVVDPSKPLDDPVGAPWIEAAAAGPLRLEASSPNPFRWATTIRYTVPSRGAAAVTIVDVTGRTIRRFADAADAAGGSRAVVWDGRDRTGAPVPAGVYFVRLDSPDGRATGKLLRLR